MHNKRHISCGRKVVVNKLAVEGGREVSCFRDEKQENSDMVEKIDGGVSACA